MPRIAIILFATAFFVGCGNSAASSIVWNGRNGNAIVLTKDVSASDEQVEFKIPISNRDSRPIRIVGMRSNCSCTQSNLPIEILPNDTSEVVVRMAIGSLLLTEDCITKEVCLIPDRGDQGIDVTLNARKSQEE